MANSLSPIIGDFLCSGRVKYIQGIPVLSNSSVASSYEPLELPSQITKQLQVKQKMLGILPCHIHYNKLLLSNFYPKTFEDRTLILSAALPEHFKWTAQQLGLDVTNIENVGL